MSRKALSQDEIKDLTAELAKLPRSIGVSLETHIVTHSLMGRDGRIVQAESNQVFEAYGLSADTPQALFLIRPDGYIAYRSDGLDLTGLKKFIASLTGGESG